MHLGQGHDEGELVVLHVELEERPPADDLEGGQHDPRDVDVRDEHVAGDLADVLEEGEVEVLVLQPGQLEVAVHVGAVGVAVAEVTVVVLAVVRHRHPAVRADAYCKRKEKDDEILIHQEYLQSGSEFSSHNFLRKKKTDTFSEMSPSISCHPKILDQDRRLKN